MACGPCEDRVEAERWAIARCGDPRAIAQSWRWIAFGGSDQLSPR